MRSRLLILIAILLAGVAAGVIAQAPRLQPGEQPGGGFLVTTNQTVTPIGLVRRTEGARPKDLALSPDGRTLAVLTTSRISFYRADGAPLNDVPHTAAALGIAWTPDSRAVYASGSSGKVYRFVEEGGRWKQDGELNVDDPRLPPPPGARQRGNSQPLGLAVSPDGKLLYVALGIRNLVAVVSLPEAKVVTSVPTGVAPYSLLLAPDGKTLFVANRGGRAGEAGAPDTAPSAGTPVRVDPKTDAARSGSLTVIDTGTLAASEIEAGRQPAGMALSSDGRTLYVASSDDDTVLVVDVPAKRVRSTISVRSAEDPGFGHIPTDVALSENANRLFVTCGGANAIAVIDMARGRVEGYLPAGWYPAAIDRREGRLFVASAKGIGSRLERSGGKYGVHSSVGTVQFIDAGAMASLPRLSRQVAENNRWGTLPASRAGRAPVPVPERLGEPSVFKHVVYVIKENHTYDLTLGDVPEGNGDKSLTLFGEEVTPNQHALARQWVLLDNTYTSGTNSADGHQWITSAIGNGYIEQNYNAHTRSYPYDGGDPLAYSPQGFLWNAAARKGLSLRVYGEFVNKPKITDPATGRTPSFKQLWDDYKAGTSRYRITADTDNAALKPFLHPRFIGFPSIVSDQWRADQFLADLREFEQSGVMPSLVMMLLPNDHTSGTRPGIPTPRAAVADNDLALGRIVDAISKSRFWRETLILVIEDDSQMGLDHVDGHRTIAYCVSPYTKRGVTVSEMYNHTSILRTIGLVLGIPPMTRFDRTATPLTALFTTQPDYRPFNHLPNRIQLDELNPPANTLRGEDRRLAEACDRLDWSDVDRADATVVARAVWRSRRPGQPFPWGAFHPVVEREDAE